MIDDLIMQKQFMKNNYKIHTAPLSMYYLNNKILFEVTGYKLRNNFLMFLTKINQLDCGCSCCVKYILNVC